MADFPAMTLWTDAYLGDTTHLTTLEHGAYLLLLIAMWRNGGVLPNDDAMLARYCKLRSDKWRDHRPTIMAFFTIDGKWITQKRLVHELSRRNKYSASQGEKARRRWLKTNGGAYAGASVRHVPSDATHTLSKSTTTSNESVAVEDGKRKKDGVGTPVSEIVASSALLQSKLMRKVASP